MYSVLVSPNIVDCTSDVHGYTYKLPQKLPSTFPLPDPTTTAAGPIQSRHPGLIILSLVILSLTVKQVVSALRKFWAGKSCIQRPAGGTRACTAAHSPIRSSFICCLFDIYRAERLRQIYWHRTMWRYSLLIMCSIRNLLMSCRRTGHHV